MYLTLIAADSMFVLPQYCNGGDLADYLQGKRSETHPDKVTGSARKMCDGGKVLECAHMIA